MTREYTLESLDCASCAAKVEAKVTKVPGVRCADVNLITKRISITIEENRPVEVWNTVAEVLESTDPSAMLFEPSAAPKQKIASTSKKPALHTLFLSPAYFTPIKVVIALLLLGCTYLPAFIPLNPILFVTAYLIVGYDVVYRALKNTLRGQLFDENFLMTIATIGALAIGEFPEAVAVMAFYQVGEYFQERALDSSRKSIAALMDIRPETATVFREGSYLVVSPEQVAIGERIRIRPGERIPLDAIVLSGSSSVDTQALTGEALPRLVNHGDDLISGCVNLTGLLEAKVSKTYGDSTVSRILDLVESSAVGKSKTEQFITSFARYYTPIVVISALLLAFIPPLLIPGATLEVWLYRALVFLVISCPCALVVSVPLGFFAGIGASARIGVLVKGGNHLHALAKVTHVVFDKTGTLTKGVFSVQEVKVREGSGFTEERLLEYAASVEHHSNHPIARSIVRAVKGAYPPCASIEELSGFGLKGKVEEQSVIVGNRALLKAEQVDVGDLPPHTDDKTEVLVAVDGRFVGVVLIADTIREDAEQALAGLRRQGVKRIVMLTGDNPQVAESVARTIGIDEVYSQLLPQDKVRKVEHLLANKPAQEKLLFVGDGINDGTSLSLGRISGWPWVHLGLMRQLRRLISSS